MPFVTQLERFEQLFGVLVYALTVQAFLELALQDRGADALGPLATANAYCGIVLTFKQAVSEVVFRWRWRAATRRSAMNDRRSGSFVLLLFSRGAAICSLYAVSVGVAADSRYFATGARLPQYVSSLLLFTVFGYAIPTIVLLSERDNKVPLKEIVRKGLVRVLPWARWKSSLEEICQSWLLLTSTTFALLVGLMGVWIAQHVWDVRLVPFAPQLVQLSLILFCAINVVLDLWINRLYYFDLSELPLTPIEYADLAAREWFFTSALLPLVEKRLKEVAPETVVDLGCGSGRATQRLARSGATNVVGVDSDPDRIRLANLLHRSRAVSFWHGDLTDTQWQTRIREEMQKRGGKNAVVAILALHLLGPLELERLLNSLPGGTSCVFVELGASASSNQTDDAPKAVACQEMKYFREHFREYFREYFLEYLPKCFRGQIQSTPGLGAARRLQLVVATWALYRHPTARKWLTSGVPINDPSERYGKLLRPCERTQLSSRVWLIQGTCGTVTLPPKPDPARIGGSPPAARP